MAIVTSPDCQPVLETARLRLLALSKEQLTLLGEDEPTLERQLDLAISPGTMIAPAKRAIRIKLARMATAPERNHAWFTYWLVVFDRLAIGSIGFKGVPDAQGEVEIGYGIAESHWNRGFGTEAVKALIDWALDQPGCRAVWGDPLKANEASNRLLSSCGAQLVRETEISNIWCIERNP